MTDVTTTSLARTPLYEWHRTHGGRLVDFAGWEMPVQYGSIAAEHTAVRKAAGLFDVSHMGRLRFTHLAGDGRMTAAFLDGVLTRRVTDMKPGQVRYSLVCNDQGGILDDVLVYCAPDDGGGFRYSLVVNASNREKIVTWLKSRLDDVPGVDMEDLTTVYSMIAVQGPKALEILQPLVDVPLDRQKYYTTTFGQFVFDHSRIDVALSRTGYTGEDGYEIIAPNGDIVRIWETVLSAGASHGAMACGLGARDTLRLEAAMPLYGHELSEQINPFEAGLGFAVNLEGREFIGREALMKAAAAKNLPQRVGLVLEGKRVPRETYKVLADDREIGHVTSGTFSPTLEKAIAMAYVDPAHAAVGKTLAVDVRGKPEPCTVVELPFYKRKA
ncbi:MAG: glycine cleavage system aminomethyltransferase GcvT [Pirellulales bacterium]